MNQHAFFSAAQPVSGEGGNEHVSERTSMVRERARTGANARMSRVGER
jgi:hypothetical protein